MIECLSEERIAGLNSATLVALFGLCKIPGMLSECMQQQREERKLCSAEESAASTDLTLLYMGNISRRVCRKPQKKKIGEWKEDSSYYSFPEGANAQLYTPLLGLEPEVQACCI